MQVKQRGCHFLYDSHILITENRQHIYNAAAWYGSTWGRTSNYLMPPWSAGMKPDHLLHPGRIIIITTNFSSNTVCASQLVLHPSRLAMGNMDINSLHLLIGARTSLRLRHSPQHHAHGRGGRHRLGGCEGHVQDCTQPDGPADIVILTLWAIVFFFTSVGFQANTQGTEKRRANPLSVFLFLVIMSL